MDIRKIKKYLILIVLILPLMAFVGYSSWVIISEIQSGMLDGGDIIVVPPFVEDEDGIIYDGEYHQLVLDTEDNEYEEYDASMFQYQYYSTIYDAVNDRYIKGALLNTSDDKLLNPTDSEINIGVRNAGYYIVDIYYKNVVVDENENEETILEYVGFEQIYIKKKLVSVDFGTVSLTYGDTDEKYDSLKKVILDNLKTTIEYNLVPSDEFSDLDLNIQTEVKLFIDDYKQYLTDAGSYSYNCEFINDNKSFTNYEIVFNEGEFEIAKAPVTLDWVSSENNGIYFNTYSATNWHPYAVFNYPFPEDDQYKTENVQYDHEGYVNANVDIDNVLLSGRTYYTVDAYTDVYTNYTVVSQNYSVRYSIKPYVLREVLYEDITDLTYDGEEVTPTIKFNLLLNDTANAIYTIAPISEIDEFKTNEFGVINGTVNGQATSAINAGYYKISVTKVDNTNYHLDSLATDINKEFGIKQFEINNENKDEYITFNDPEVVYFRDASGYQNHFETVKSSFVVNNLKSSKDGFNVNITTIGSRNAKDKLELADSDIQITITEFINQENYNYKNNITDKYSCEVAKRTITVYWTDDENKLIATSEEYATYRYYYGNIPSPVPTIVEGGVCVGDLVNVTLNSYGKDFGTYANLNSLGHIDIAEFKHELDENQIIEVEELPIENIDLDKYYQLNNKLYTYVDKEFEEVKYTVEDGVIIIVKKVYNLPETYSATASPCTAGTDDYLNYKVKEDNTREFKITTALGDGNYTDDYKNPQAAESTLVTYHGLVVSNGLINAFNSSNMIRLDAKDTIATFSFTYTGEFFEPKADFNSDYISSKDIVNVLVHAKKFGESEFKDLVRDAGFYDCNFNGLDNTNFELSNGDLPETFVINPKPVSISWDNYDDKLELVKLVYNGIEQLPTAFIPSDELAILETVNEDGSITSAREICKVETITLDKYINANSYISGKTFENATTYYVKAIGLDNPNYIIKDEFKNDYEFRIIQAELTVTANNHSIIYGDVPSNNDVSFNGFVNNEDRTVLGAGLTFDYSYTQYGDVKWENEKIVPYIGAIRPSGYSKTTNYHITYLPGDLTVNQRELTLYWQTSDAKLEYQFKWINPNYLSNKVNNDDVFAVVSGEQINANANPQGFLLEGNSNYKAYYQDYDGEYLFGDKAKNYYLNPNTVMEFEYVITQKVAEISFTETSFIYDKKAYTPFAVVSNICKGDSCQVNTIAFEGETEIDAIVVGTYNGKVISLGNSNYCLGSTLPETEFTITAKPLTVSWSNLEHTYNKQAYTPNADLYGVCSGDEVLFNVLAGEINAGTYEATISSLSGKDAFNYKYDVNAITKKNYTIKPLSVTATFSNLTHTYDKQVFAPIVELTNIIDGDIVIAHIETQNSAKAAINAGVYTSKVVSISGESHENYVLDTTITTQFEIKKAPVLISWVVGTYTYNGLPQKPSASLSGIYDGDVCTPVIEGAEINAGTYTATINELSGSSKDNYIISDSAEKEQGFTISKRVISLGWDNTTVVYNTDIQRPVAIISNLVAGDSYVIDVEHPSAVNVGTYTATAVSVSNENYVLPSSGLGTQFTITAANISTVSIKQIQDQFYNKQEIKVSPTLTYYNETLVEGTDYELDYSSDLINLGTVTITINGKGNYEGVTTTSYEIVKDNVIKAVFTYNDEQKYTGSQVKPSVIVTLGGNILVKDEDYEVTYGENINLGEGTIIVKGINNYEGSVTLRFNIVKNELDVTITNDVVLYNREAQYIVVNIHSLNSSNKYEVTYVDKDNNIVAEPTEAGTYYYTVVVEANENYYEAEIKGEFVIEKANVNNLTNASTIIDKPYTSEAITQQIVIKYNEYVLTNEEVKVEYTDNIEAGIATIIITGIGNNYTGEIRETFIIKQVNLNDVTVSNIEDQIYTSEQLKPEFTLSLGNYQLINGTDYTVIYGANDQAGENAGSITIKAVVDGNFIGERTIYFNIIKNSIVDPTRAEIIDYVENVIYDGNNKEFEFEVYFDQEQLEELVDYVVSYYVYNNEENTYEELAAGSFPINVGKYLVKVSGINLFTGEADYKFEIGQFDISTDSRITVESIKDKYFYTSVEIKPIPIVKFNDLELVNTDQVINYTVTYNRNIELTTDELKAQVIITGEGNFTGERIVEFAIAKETFEDIQIELSLDKYTYTSKQIKPIVEVTLNNKVLTEGTDYEVSYGENINAGVDAGTIIITALSTSIYSGSQTFYFDIEKAELTFDIEDSVSKNYDGSEYVFGTLTDSDKEQVITYYNLPLDNDEKEQLSSAPVNAGTYYVLITVEEGSNYLAGEKEVKLIINKIEAEFIQDDITVDYLEDYTVNAGYTVAGAIDSSKEVAITYSTSDNSKPVNAGTYTATLSVEEGTNHLATSKTINITINKIDATITVDNSTIIEDQVVVSVDYDNTEHFITATTTATTTLEFVGNDGFRNVDEYVITITSPLDDNYNETTITVTLIINKVTPTISTSSFTATYGTDYSLDALYSYDPIDDEAKVTIKYYYLNNASQYVECAKPSLAGKYYYSVSVSETDNIYANSTLNNKDESLRYTSFTINKAQISFIDNYEIIYGQAYDLTNVSYSPLDSNAKVTIKYYSDKELTEEISKPVNVGTYYYTVTVEGTDNIIANSTLNSEEEDAKYITLSIKKANITISTENFKLPYGEYYYIEEYFSYSPLDSDANIIIKYYNSLFEELNSKPFDAGTYYYTVTVEGTDNINGNTTTYVEYVIEKTTIEFKDSYVITYGDSYNLEHSYTPLDKNATVTVTYYADKELTEEISRPVDVGTYYCKVEVEETNNIYGSSTDSLDLGYIPLKINQLVIDGNNVKAIINDIPQQKYEGVAIEPLPEITVITDNGFAEVLTLNKDYILTYENNNFVNEHAKVIIKFQGNYTSEEPIVKEFTISASGLSEAELDEEISDRVYDGTEYTPTSGITLYGTQLELNTDYTVKYQIFVNGEWIDLEEGTLPVNAGRYAIVFTANPESIYEGYKLVEFNITQKALFVELTNELDVVYNNSSLEITTNKPTDVEVSHVISLLGNTVTEIINVGTYTVTTTVVNNNSNYSLADEDAVFTTTINVTPYAVEVAFNDASLRLPYNGEQQIPTATASGLFENTECEVLVETLDEAINVGTYKATIIGLSNPNYEIKYLEGQTSIETEYDIIKKDIQIAIDNKEITYLDDAPEFTATFIGLVDGENVEDVITYVLGTTYNTGDDVDYYNIFLDSYNSTNYNITNSDAVGILTVNQKDPVVPELHLTAVYGQTLENVNINEGISEGKFAFVDELSTKVGTVNGENQFKVTYTPNDTNYKEITTFVTIIVTKATLTVTVGGPYEITYGENAPVNEYAITIEGFVYGETDTVVNKENLTFKDNYKAFDAATDYEIIASGLEADNYEFEYVSGMLKVAARSIEDAIISELNINESNGQYEYEFTGEAIDLSTLTVTYKYSEETIKTLVINNDYVVKYYAKAQNGEFVEIEAEDIINVNIYKVEIIGTNNYNKSISVNVAVTNKSIEDAEIEITNADKLIYNSITTPIFNVTLDGATLVLDKDFTLQFVDSLGNDISVTDQEGNMLVDENINAGDYYIVITGKGNYNTETSASCEFTIDKATQIITPVDIDFTYNGGDHTIEVTVLGDVNPETDITYNIETVKDAGTYDIIVTVEECTNYKAYVEKLDYTFQVTVDRFNVNGEGVVNEVNIETNLATYNPNGVFTPTITAVTSDGITVANTDYEVSYLVKVTNEFDEISWEKLTGEPTYAGDYKLVLTMKDTGNFSGTISETEFTIEKAENELINAVYSFAYDGTEKQITAKAHEDAEISFIGDVTSLIDIGRAENITVVIGETDNYKETIIEGKSLEVTERDINNIKLENITYNAPTEYVYIKEAYYINDSHILINDLVDETAKELLLGTDYYITYLLDGKEVEKPTNAGTYTVIIKGMGNYGEEYKERFEFTIAPQEITISVKENIAVTYGDDFTYNEESYIITGDVYDILSVELTTDYVAGDSVDGTYDIDITEIVNTNYSIKYVGNSLTVNTLKVTINWVDKKEDVLSYVYNSLTITPEAEVVGLLFEDQVNVIVEGGARNVGNNYLATATSLTSTDNSHINYEIDLTQNTHTTSYSITPKEITVTWNYENTPYNGQEQIPTPTLSGAVTIDEVTDDVTYTTPALVKALEAINRGEYTVTIELTGADAANYKFAEGHNSYTYEITARNIDNADITATFNAEIGQLTYNGEDQNVNSKVSVTDAIYSVTTIATDFVVTYKDKDGNIISDPTNAGTYTVIINGKDDSNYTGSKETTLTITINKKDATVTALDQSIVYEQWIDTNKYVFDGLVDKDLNSFTAVLNTTYVQYDDIPTGKVEITIEEIESINYNFEYISGELTVTPRPVTFTWTGGENFNYIYDGKAQAPIATITETIYGTCGINYVELVAINASATAYTAEVASLTNTNYMINTEGSTHQQAFMINPKVLTFSWVIVVGEEEITNGSVVYDNTSHIPTATANGVVEIDGIPENVTWSIKLANDLEVAINATNYRAIITLDDTDVNNNYVIDTNYYDYVITPRPIIKSEIGLGEYGTLIYSGYEQTIDSAISISANAIGVSELVLNTDYELDYSNNKNAGTAYITVIGKGNYSGTFTKVKEFTISPKELTVTANPYTILYGDTSNNTVSYDGFVTVEGVTETASVLTGSLTFLPYGESSEYVQYTSGVGTYDIIPSGYVEGNYYYTYVEGTITVKERPLNDSNVTFELDGYDVENPFIFNWCVQVPEVILTLNGTYTIDSSNYEVVYLNKLGEEITNPTDADVYTIVLTAKDSTNYTSSRSDINFTINPKDINDVTTAPAFDGTAHEGLEFNNQEHKPTNVTVGDTSGVVTFSSEPSQHVLGLLKDFTLSYENNFNATTVDNLAKIIITGTGNFFGTHEEILKFEIAKAPVTITIDNKPFVIYGDEIPTYTATFDGIITGDETVDPIKVTYACEYAMYKVAGNYTISIDSYTSDNYVITNTDATAILTVSPRDLSSDKITNTSYAVDEVISFEYNNTVRVPILELKLNNEEILNNGTHYSVSYTKYDEATSSYKEFTGNIIDVGRYQVVLTAIDDDRYTGTRTIDFEITPRNINEAFAELGDYGTLTYTGKDQFVNKYITVTDTDIINDALTSDDYTLSYSDSINAGTHTITITGIGNYTGTYTNNAIKYVINKAPLTVTAKDHQITFGDKPANKGLSYGVMVDGEMTNYFVNGETELTVAPTVDVTYSYSYKQYDDITTNAVIYITGMEYQNYVVTHVEGTLTVVARDLDDKEFISKSLSEIDGEYDGIGKEPTPTLKLNDYLTLVKDTYNDNVPDYTVSYKVKVDGVYVALTTHALPTNVGSYKVVFTAKENTNYVGSTELDFTITPRSINKASTPVLDGSMPELVFDNTSKESIIVNYVSIKDTINNEEVTLVLGRDYILSYSDSINAGTTHTITLTGIGNYEFSHDTKLTYTIKPRDINEAIASLGSYEALIYNGSPHTIDAAVSVTDTSINMGTLLNGTHYYLEYSNNINAGTNTAIITVKGTGNYNGTYNTNLLFTINQREISINWAVTNNEFNGTPITPNYTLGNVVPNENVDIEWTFNEGDGIAVGQYTVTATLKGEDSVISNYYIKAAHITYTYNVVERNISKTTVTNSIPSDLVYNGTIQTVENYISIKDVLNNIDVTLEKGTDYTITYKQNGQPVTPKDHGTYTVVITGTGNYIGIIDTITYTIGQKTLIITANNHTITYGDVESNDGVTYNGFVIVNGIAETEAVLGGTLEYSYGDYTIGSNIGTYIIKPNGLTSNNYDIDFQPGVLTVEKADLENTTIEFSNATNTNEYSYVSGLPTIEFKVLFKGNAIDNTNDSVYTVSYKDSNGKDIKPNEVKNVGTYYLVITAIDSETNNFKETNEFEFVIVPAKATITVNDLTSTSVEYGDEVPTAITENGLQYIISGVYNNELEITGLTNTGKAGSSVGKYEIGVSCKQNANYDVDVVVKEYNIVARAITITPNAAESDYSKSIVTNGYTAVRTNGLSGDAIYGTDNLKIVLETTATASSDVGNYDITFSYDRENANYYVTEQKGVYTINRLAVSTVGNLITFNYNQSYRTAVEIFGQISDQKILKFTSNNEELSNPVKFDIVKLEDGDVNYIGDALSNVYLNGSTYKASIRLGNNYYFENTNYETQKTIDFKYQTVWDGSSWYTIEDAITSSSGTTLRLAGNENNYVTTVFTQHELYKRTELTIKNKTLIVPFKDSNDQYELLDSTISGYVYSVLIIDLDIKLKLENSTLITAASLESSTITRNRGVIMNYGSIIADKTSHINSYGYIKGTGSIILSNGSTTLDMMRIHDWPGGFGALGTYEEILPFNAWSMHNISCNVDIQSGATYNAFVYFVLSAGSYVIKMPQTFTVFGNKDTSNCVFKPINDTGHLYKSAEDAPNSLELGSIEGSNQTTGQRDLIIIDGDYKDGQLQLTIDVDSAIENSVGALATLAKLAVRAMGIGSTVVIETNTNKPIVLAYLDITVGLYDESNYSYKESNLEISSADYLILPGCKFKINENSIVTVSNNADIIIGDYDNIKNLGGNLNFINAGYYKETNLAEAIVNGTLIIDGGNISGKILSDSNNLTGCINFVRVVNRDDIGVYSEYKMLRDNRSKSEDTDAGIGYISNTIKQYAVGNINNNNSYFKNGVTYYSKNGVWTTSISISYDDKFMHDNLDKVTYNHGTIGYILTADDLPMLSQEHYRFDGWYSANTKYNIGDIVYESLTFTAKWTPIDYTILFNLDGGTVSTNNKNTYTIESEDFMLNEPTRTGYTFVGWTGSNGDTPEKNLWILEGTTGNLTYTANWIKNVYTINYGLNGGIVSESNPENYSVDTDSFKLNNPTREHYNFIGWTGSNGNSPQLDVTINMGSVGNLSFTANWSPISYSIIYVNKVNGEDLIVSYESDNPNSFIESDIINLMKPTSDGYSFTGWYLDSKFTGNSISQINGSTLVNYLEEIQIGNETVSGVYIYSKWISNEAETYTITFNSNGGTAVAPIIAEPGEIITRPLDPTRNGYTFAGWDTDIPEIMPASDLTITAHWTPIEYSITYNLNGGTTNTSNSIKYTIETEDFTLINPTKVGYTFIGWTGYNGNNAETNVIVEQGTTGDLTFTANWTIINYTITYNLDGGTIANSSAKSYTYETNSFVLNKPTKAHYVFAGWTGSNGEIPEIEVTVAKGTTGNLTYTANWTPVEYTITYNLDGGTNNINNPSSYNIETDNFNLEVPTKEGYRFIGWTGSNGETPADDVTISKGTTGNLVYTAKWIQQLTVTYNANKGTVTPGSVTVDYGLEIKLPTPTRNNYKFTGWYTAAEGGTKIGDAGASYKPISNITIYAQWEYDICIAAGTLVTMSDGTLKKVENVMAGETVLVFNHETGQIEPMVIMYNAHSEIEWTYYIIINMEFSDGTILKVINEHAAFDTTLNRYVFINENTMYDYIGHMFYKMNVVNGEYIRTDVELIDVYTTLEYTGIYNPISYYHLNFFANGLLTTAGSIEKLINNFDYDYDLSYNEESYNNNINEYGIYTYEELKEYYSEDVFNSIPIQYVKIAVGKGIISFEEAKAIIDEQVEAIERYYESIKKQE